MAVFYFLLYCELVLKEVGVRGKTFVNNDTKLLLFKLYERSIFKQMLRELIFIEVREVLLYIRR